MKTTIRQPARPNSRDISVFCQKKDRFFIKEHLSRCLKIVLCTLLCLCVLPACKAEESIRIGTTKDPQEAVIAWMLALLTMDAGQEVKVIEISGGIQDLQPALASGSLDAAVEYSQSAWTYVLKKDGMYTGEQLTSLQQDYLKQQLLWIPVSMVVDHYTLGVRFDAAAEHNLETLSGLARVSDTLTLGADSAYFQREDGFPRLKEVYDFQFKTTKDLASEGLYPALSDDKIQVMPVHTLYGLYEDEMLVLLEDDQKAYPDSTAGIVLQEKLVHNVPEIEEAAWMIAGSLNTVQMRQLCRLVDKKDLSAPQAAAFYLCEMGWADDDDEVILYARSLE